MCALLGVNSGDERCLAWIPLGCTKGMDTPGMDSGLCAACCGHP